MLALLLFLTGPSCKNLTESKNHVTQDEKFRKLFYSESGGLTGADGLFSILLPDGSSIFFVGDCFLGEVVNGSRDTGTRMLRNAGNHINKENTTAVPVIRGSIDDPLTLMEPVNEKGDTTYRWYWPGHGLVKNDTLYVFALNLYNDPSLIVRTDKPENEADILDEMTETMFAFRISRIDLHSFKYPGFTHLETNNVDIDYSRNQIDFGNCIMVDEGYVYIYGTKIYPDKAKIHVARIPLESNALYTGWEFYDGTEWNDSICNSIPMETDVSVSEQFSIFRYGSKYILLTQERGGADIYAYVSDFPHKSFQNRKFIYHTTESETDTSKMIFTYNALAHQQFIENDELLVSYCVNSFNVRDVYDNVEAYRAKFLRVPMALILSEKDRK